MIPFTADIDQIQSSYSTFKKLRELWRTTLYLGSPFYIADVFIFHSGYSGLIFASVVFATCLAWIFGKLVHLQISRKTPLSESGESDAFHISRTSQSAEVLFKTSEMQLSKIESKRSGGSQSSIGHERGITSYKNASIKIGEPQFWIATNQVSFCFLADRLLVFSPHTVRAYSYSKLELLASTTKFLNDPSSIPSDAVVIDWVWEKLNASGTPDKRFKDNRKLPVCQYGVLTFSLPNNKEFVFLTSNPETSESLATTIALSEAAKAYDGPYIDLSDPI